jgi:tape measure domain-containing protein
MAEGVMLVAKFSADVHEFTASMNQVKDAAAGAADSIKLIGQGAASGDLTAMAQGAKGLGGSLMDMGGAAMDAVFELQMIVDVAKQVGQALLGSSVAAQESKQEFTDAMGGDVEAANKLYDAIQQIAEAKGMDTSGLEKVGVYMEAIGVATANIAPEMDAVAGAVAKVGGGADMVQNVVQALSKMQDEGKVTALSMTRLQDTGVNAWQALAAGMGVSVPDAMKKVQSGTLDATTAVNEMVIGFQKLDGATTETNTLTGAWTKFTDQLGSVASKVFGPLIDGLTIVLGLVSKAIDGIGDLGTMIGKAFGNDNAGKIDAQSQAFKDWATSSGSAAASTDTFNAANNQTAGALTKTAAAAAGATAATMTSTSATTAYTSAATAQGTVIAGTTERFAPYAAGVKAADIATANAAGSAGTYSWALSSGAQAYTVSADKAAAFAQQTADITTKLQEGAKAAKTASTAIGDVIPGSLQDQINNAGNGMGTLAVHFTNVGVSAHDSSAGLSKAVSDMDSNIQLFAQDSGQSFDKASQNVADYAKFTGQSMDNASKALSMSNVKPVGLDQYRQDSEGILGRLGDDYAAFAQQVSQVLGNIGSTLGSYFGNAGAGGAGIPQFAAGVQGYTGMAIVGESGPELVSLNGGSVYPLTGTGGANLPAMGGGMSGGPVSIQVIMDSQVIAQAVLPQIAPQIRMAVGRRA